jgi:hypothetical protein
LVLTDRGIDLVVLIDRGIDLVVLTDRDILFVHQGVAAPQGLPIIIIIIIIIKMLMPVKGNAGWATRLVQPSLKPLNNKRWVSLFNTRVIRVHCHHTEPPANFFIHHPPGWVIFFFFFFFFWWFFPKSPSL